MKFTTRKLTVLSMLAAIAVLLIILNFPLPFFPPYLKFDFADIPVLVGSFAFGPVAGVLITLIASFIQSFFVVGDAPYGFIMHAAATSSLAIYSGYDLLLLAYKEGRNHRPYLRCARHDRYDDGFKSLRYSVLHRHAYSECRHAAAASDCPVQPNKGRR